MLLPPALNWPLAVVICVSIGLAGVLVLYLVVRIRSNKRQQNPLTQNGDDFHSQMEWEDDIGLNITVNPLDETKKAVPPVNLHQVEQSVNGYSAATSDNEQDDDDDDDDEYEHDGQHEYSSDDDEDLNQQRNHTRKTDHQLEWDDAAIEYGPKKV